MSEKLTMMQLKRNFLAQQTRIAELEAEILNRNATISSDILKIIELDDEVIELESELACAGELIKTLQNNCGACKKLNAARAECVELKKIIERVADNIVDAKEE